jgi:hypothetical protein
MSKFDAMLALFEQKEFDLKELKKQYRNKSLIHHPDRGGDENKFKDLIAGYELLLPLVEGNTSEEILDKIRKELTDSSPDTKKEILAQIKSMNANAFRLLGFNENDNIIKVDIEKEWISINTNVLNGDILSNKNFNSVMRISCSRYSTFFTPYTSKEDALDELKNTAVSSLKLFVYLSLSVSAIDFIAKSFLFFGIPIVGHDVIYVDPSNLKNSMNDFSLQVKLALYSTLLDSLFTLVNPVVNLLSLVVRSGATIASAVSYIHEENEKYVAPLGLTAN